MKCIEDEIPFDLPAGWEWSRINTLCKMSNGTSKRSGKDGIETIVLRLANLSERDITYTDCL